MNNPPTDYADHDRYFCRVIQGVFGPEARVVCHRQGDDYWSFDFDRFSLHREEPLEPGPWTLSTVAFRPGGRWEPDDYEPVEVGQHGDFPRAVAALIHEVAVARQAAVLEAMGDDAYAQDLAAERAGGWL